MNFFAKLNFKLHTYWRERFLPFSHQPGYVWLVALACFFDAFLFIVPSDIIMVISSVAQPRRSLRFLFWGSFGGSLSHYVYFFASFFYAQQMLDWLSTLFEIKDYLIQAQDWIQHWGPLAIIPWGLTPFPGQIMIIACGLAHSTVWQVMLCIFLARFTRFGAVIGLTHLGYFKLTHHPMPPPDIET